MSKEPTGDSLRSQIIAETRLETDVVRRAISDTWSFMTGEEMPPEAIETAIARSKGRRPDQLWRLKFREQALNHKGLEKRATGYWSRSIGADISSVQLDAVIREGLAEEDIVATELVTMLGERILDTAYRFVGEDADQVVEDTIKKMSVATTMEDKANALFGGVMERYEQAKESIVAAEQLLKSENGRQINHIAKLSPITIGKAPNLNFTPSCLAFSIISASFFKKCGVENMIHGGVVSIYDRPYAGAAYLIAEDIDRTLRVHLQPYSDKFEQSLLGIKKDAGRIVLDYDPHSAVLVEIDGTWVIFDPYMDHVVATSKKESSKLDKAHKLLAKHPALEYIFHPNNELSHLCDAIMYEFVFDIFMDNLPNIQEWRRTLDLAIAFQSIEPLRATLEKLTDGRMPLTDLLSATGIFTAVLSRYKDGVFMDEEVSESPVSPQENYINQAIAKHVFEIEDLTEGAIKSCLERCDRDERYRERIVENLNTLPQKLLLGGLQEVRGVLQRNEKPYIDPHGAFEIRNMAHGVGMTSLLDVSYGLNNELSLAFWARQTSSQLPLLYEYQSGREERLGGVSLEVARILKRFVEIDDSSYPQLSDII